MGINFLSDATFLLDVELLGNFYKKILAKYSIWNPVQFHKMVDAMLIDY